MAETLALLSPPDPGCLAVFLDQTPGRLAVEVPTFQAGAVRCHRPEEGALPIIPDASLLHIGEDWPCRIEQDFPPFSVAFLGHVQVVARRRPR